MAKLRLDYATLARSNPKLIYASHKGFLPGPYENRLALDEVVQMMAGLSYMTGPPRAGAAVSMLLPLTMGGERLGVLRPLPAVGADTDTVLQRWLSAC